MTYIRISPLSFLLIILFCSIAKATLPTMEEALDEFASAVKNYKEDPKEETALQIRQYEVVLSTKEGIEPWEDLWVDDGTPPLKVETVTLGNLSDYTDEFNDETQNIKDYILKGGSYLLRLNYKNPPRFRRLPSQYEYAEDKFVIGGERDESHPKPEIYTLNFEKDFLPDIFGQAEDVAALVAIPDEKFMHIEFDWIDYGIFYEETIKEYSRILKPSGRLIIKTNRNTKEWNEGILSEIKDICKRFEEEDLINVSQDPLEIEEDEVWSSEGEKFFYRIEFEKTSGSP